MKKKRIFIGRQGELTRLRQLYKKKSASFVVIKGRRRVGKSRLVEEFSHEFEKYYKFEGLAPEKGVLPVHQLEEFCQQISRQFHLPKALYQDWSDAFWAVGNQVQQGRTLLFFDEISWMGDGSPTFLAKLKSFWDNLLTQNPQLIFIVCSSASSWVEKNLLSGTGFIGRVSLTLTIEELPMSACRQFWPKRIDAYEIFKILSVIGGIPRYLEEIDPASSAEENIKRLCFMEGGLLVNEFNRIFSDLFMRESQFYEFIVMILATGSKTFVQIQYEIEQSVGAGNQYGRLSEYLWELEEVGFIRRDYAWDIQTGQDKRLSKYRLQDNYLRFYLRYIKPNRAKIKSGAYVLKSLFHLPAWNSVLGLQFENLVLNNRSFIHHMLGLQADEIVNDNPFFQRKTNRMSGCQIDYMIQTKFNGLYVCEIKFSKDKINTSVIKEVEAKLACLNYPKGFSCRPVLIHVNGVSSDLVERDYFANIIDFTDFMAS